MTSVTPLHLDWPNCLNARDLGGLPTADGRTIRREALVRTDNHTKLTEEGVRAVKEYGVSRIIDLRRTTECERAPSPFQGSSLYRSIPVQDPADPDNESLSLAEIYIAMLDLRPQLFAAAVGAIADAPPGPVVVHCAGGKDRTGMVVAMALRIAGVEPDVIAQDYALSQERLAEENAAVLARIEDPVLRENVRRLQVTAPETMLTTLAHLESRYGGVAEYLKGGGLTDDQLTALRQRLV
ncbi:protein tyrosine/serine phosphatase [Thermasporomyces composti]|uniref:Protein tyrosine/serine phosphatase n=1 Tax=Thermasporomyces composti TaxID=696763 RepID=A0A3D9V488_THECX|nr:protein tyrosine/serine phosphatase [Thermasporomyces composti]